jgi:branched-subunit amino acid transport protein AzlD
LSVNQNNYLPFFKTTLNPGVDVMITIFCDFSQFSAKKLTFFSKTNVMIKILHNIALFWVKNAIFSLNFSAKIFKKS